MLFFQCPGVSAEAGTKQVGLIPSLLPSFTRTIPLTLCIFLPVLAIQGCHNNITHWVILNKSNFSLFWRLGSPKIKTLANRFPSKGTSWFADGYLLTVSSSGRKRGNKFSVLIRVLIPHEGTSLINLSNLTTFQRPHLQKVVEMKRFVAFKL